MAPLNRPMKLILIDGQTNPNVIARETAKLFKQEPEVAGLIGFSDTDMVLAAAPIAAKYKHVFLTSGATSPKLPREVPQYLFLACFGDNVQAAAGAEWAVKTLKSRSAVVLYKQNSSYARLLHGYFQTRFKQLGGKVLTVRPYRLAGIKSTVKGLPKADLVYLAAQPDDVVAAIAALRDAGVEVPILGGDGLDIGDAWQKVAHADKIYFTTHAYLGAANPDVRVASAPVCAGMTGEEEPSMQPPHVGVHQPQFHLPDHVRSHRFAGTQGGIRLSPCSCV